MKYKICLKPKHKPNILRRNPKGSSIPIAISLFDAKY